MQGHMAALMRGVKGVRREGELREREAEAPPRVAFFEEEGEVQAKEKKRRRRRREEAPREVSAGDVGNAASARKSMSLSVSAGVRHAPLSSWRELARRFQGVPAPLVLEVRKRWPSVTPVQAQVVPLLLSGRDVLGVAPTGSGKTLSFLVPALALLGRHCGKGPRVLVLAPTRELARQLFHVADSVCGEARVCLLSKKRVKAAAHCDLLVSTPMRVVNAGLDLSRVQLLVLDEGDRLLSEQFREQVDAVAAACTLDTRCTALFTATMGGRVEREARSFMREPAVVRVGGTCAMPSADVLQQHLVYSGTEEGKMTHFRQLLREGLQPPVLIFMQSKDRANALFKELVYEKINADVLTGDRTPEQRERTVDQFRSGQVWVLIATELVARGMDFKAVNVVINWDMPATTQEYIHRIGRAGRAGRKGEAVTYYTDEDLPIVKAVANLIQRAGGSVPEWLDELETPSQSQREKYARNQPDRKQRKQQPSKWKSSDNHSSKKKKRKVKV